jgi:hypothetical protein
MNNQSRNLACATNPHSPRETAFAGGASEGASRAAAREVGVLCENSILSVTDRRRPASVVMEIKL